MTPLGGIKSGQIYSSVESRGKNATVVTGLPFPAAFAWSSLALHSGSAFHGTIADPHADRHLCIIFRISSDHVDIISAHAPTLIPME